MSADYLINGSGLFFFGSSLDKETKERIVEWYNNLPEEDKKMVDTLRQEATDEADFFANNPDF